MLLNGQLVFKEIGTYSILPHPMATQIGTFNAGLWVSSFTYHHICTIPPLLSPKFVQST